MKSSPIELKKRGYADDEDLSDYKNYRIQELLALLNDKLPHKRTIGAKLLKKEKEEEKEEEKEKFLQPEIAQSLCNTLKKEKKLYTKIALTETLASFGEISLPFLIPLLGKIGNNQYKTVPEKKFLKKNYPLPRDIIARTIIRIGEESLPLLEEIALNGERKQFLEAIDAIGFISFYSLNKRSLPILWKMLEKYPKDDILTWKVVRALESFPNAKVIAFLENLLKQNALPGIKIEAKRSLTQIKKLSVISKKKNHNEII